LEEKVEIIKEERNNVKMKYSQNVRIESSSSNEDLLYDEKLTL
jgi:hypothetical protein